MAYRLRKDIAVIFSAYFTVDRYHYESDLFLKFSSLYCKVKYIAPVMMSSAQEMTNN